MGEIKLYRLAGTSTYEDWVERCNKYRSLGFMSLLKAAERERDLAYKQRRFR